MERHCDWIQTGKTPPIQAVRGELVQIWKDGVKNYNSLLLHMDIRLPLTPGHRQEEVQLRGPS